MSKKKLLAILLLVCIIGIGIYKLYEPTKGFFFRTFLTPKIVKEHEFVDLSYSYYPNKEKLAFYKVYRKGEGSYGLKRRVITIEATEVTVYILTENGQLTEVRDYTRDPFSNRDFQIRCPEKILLCYKDDNNQFVPVEDVNDINGEDLRLKFNFPEYDSNY